MHRDRQKKGSPLTAALCRDAEALGLGQVVTERGPDHVVDGMRGEAGGRTDAVAAGPSEAGEVRVLQTPLEPTLFALVDFVPEAEGGFGDVSSVARASAAAAPGVPVATWGNFQSAAGVVGVGRTVTANPVGSNGRSGQRRVAEAVLFLPRSRAVGLRLRNLELQEC